MMRKILTLLTVLVLLFSNCMALAEGTFTMAGYDTEDVGHDWSTNAFFTRMTEKTGIVFEFLQYGDYGKYKADLPSLLAGEKAPDVLFKAGLTTAETQRYYEDGLLIDLTPWLQSAAPNLWTLLQSHPDWLKAITLPDGAIVALPAINLLQNNNAMWINKTWLKNVRMETPTTAEELTDVLRAFKTGDPNKNGTADEIPLSFIGMWDLKWLSHAFGINANDYYLTVDETGKVSEVLTTDTWRAFLTWLHDLWEEGLIDRNGFNTADSLRQITDKDAVMTYGMFLCPTPLNVIPSASLSQYSLLMPLTYEGKQVYRDFLGDVIRGTFAITSACKDPAALLNWVDYLYTEEGSRLAQCGEEGTDYFWNENGKWEWLQDTATVANTVLAENTISEGATSPGLTTAEFQLLYDDEVTHNALEQLTELKQVCTAPCPAVWLDAEQEKHVTEIQTALSSYAEAHMAQFVVGDTELSDDNWNTFCAEVRRLGVDELVSIFTNMLK